MYNSSRKPPIRMREQIQRLRHGFFRRGQRDRGNARQQPVDQQVHEVNADDRCGRDGNTAALATSGTSVVISIVTCVGASL